MFLRDMVEGFLALLLWILFDCSWPDAVIDLSSIMPTVRTHGYG